MTKGKLPEEVVVELGLMRRAAPVVSKTAAKPAASPQAAAAGPSDGAVQMLALLQRESRIVDFLMEDIGGYSDEQVGSALRGVHEQCRTVLNRHLKLSPVVDGVEGTQTRLAAAGLDAKDTARLKLVGNVPADGKVEAGILRHRGWRAEMVDLPALKAGERAMIVAPAEIEVE
ncbi:MAG: DUF2760 domain-containing protein [Acidobacteriia bacterium]|nr:DUF2760 domain-containing protein [Terriglobia bacterium]